jgi:hypothetical protein
VDVLPLIPHNAGCKANKGKDIHMIKRTDNAQADQIRLALNRIGQFFNGLSRTAEQLSVEARWAVILSAAFIKWLRGKILHPVTEGDQILLQLGT